MRFELSILQFVKNKLSERTTKLQWRMEAVLKQVLKWNMNHTGNEWPCLLISTIIKAEHNERHIEHSYFLSQIC